MKPASLDDRPPEAPDPAQTPGSERYLLSHLGWLAWAERIARRAERRVPAYREFVAPRERHRTFKERPVTSKESYILRFPASQVLAEDQRNVFAIFRSSGASGRAMYWPYLRFPARYAGWNMQYFLEYCFAIRHKKTLAIVADALGSWMGGDELPWVLKCVSMRVRYHFSVITPGNNQPETIEIINDLEPRVDQIILFLCPSYVPYLQLQAESMGKRLPLDKLRYLVFGEPIPESLRMRLQADAGVPPHEPFMLSLYASADTGMLGVESPASVALRKLLTLNEELASELGFSQPIPHLFHYAAPDAYLETLGGELCVTRWQGVPIVRYNLHDRARLYRWRALREAVLKSNSIAAADEPWREVIRKSPRIFSDLIALEGRSDALIFGGSNFSAAMLDEVVHAPALQSVLSGMYKVRAGWRGSRQVLEWDLELRPGTTVDAANSGRVYDGLIQGLCRVQSGFRNNWGNMYAAFDSDPARRILELRWHPWPQLSRELDTRPKRSTILD